MQMKQKEGFVQTSANARPVAILKTYSDGTKLQYLYFNSSDTVSGSAKFILHKSNGTLVQMNYDESIFKLNKLNWRKQILPNGDINIFNPQKELTESKQSYTKYLTMYKKYFSFCTENISLETKPFENELIETLYTKLIQSEQKLSRQSYDFTQKLQFQADQISQKNMQIELKQAEVKELTEQAEKLKAEVTSLTEKLFVRRPRPFLGKIFKSKDTYRKARAVRRFNLFRPFRSAAKQPDGESVLDMAAKVAQLERENAELKRLTESPMI